MSIHTKHDDIHQKMAKVLSDLTMHYDRLDSEYKDKMFGHIINCTINKEIRECMSELKRIELSNQIMSYIVKDARAKKIMPENDTDDTLSFT